MYYVSFSPLFLIKSWLTLNSIGNRDPNDKISYLDQSPAISLLSIFCLFSSFSFFDREKLEERFVCSSSLKKVSFIPNKPYFDTNSLRKFEKQVNKTSVKTKGFPASTWRCDSFAAQRLKIKTATAQTAILLPIGAARLLC